jgi:hypothetical protein
MRATSRAIHAAHDEDGYCASDAPRITSEQMAATLQREQGTEYLHAAQQRGGVATGSQRLLARQAFTRSLDIDPYHQPTRRDLNLLLAERAFTQTRRRGNARCRLGGRLRAAGLLPEATTVPTERSSASSRAWSRRSMTR